MPRAKSTVARHRSKKRLLRAAKGYRGSHSKLLRPARLTLQRAQAMSYIGRKLKKRDMSPVIHLERTPDILDSVRPLKDDRLYVGFAAETENVLAEARAKLMNKGLDLIVANDVSRPDSGFEADTNRVTFLTPDGGQETLPLLPKEEVARRIVRWLEQRRG